jgi:hypothetical protein
VKSPRLNISLPPDVVAMVSTIAELQGMSQAAVIREILVETMPVLKSLAETLQNIRHMEAMKGDAIRATIQGAEKEAQQAAATMMALLSKMESSTQDAAGDVGREPKAKAAQRRSAPPSC